MVPSQINYVIKTRFTESRGTPSESKRGGGEESSIGRIGILKPPWNALWFVVFSVGDEVN